MSRLYGHYLAALGLIVSMVGLGLDVWMHARDDVALQTEDIFTLTNPGHVLFGGGLVMTAAGVVLALTWTDADKTQMRAPIGRLLAGMLIIAMAAVFAFGFVAAGGDGHTHLAGGAAGLSNDDLERLGLREDVRALIDTAHHDDGVPEAEPLKLSMAEASKLGAEVALARKTAESYVSIDYALSQGFLEVSQDLPLLGAHFVNPGYASDGVFEITKPEMLIYAYENGRWRLYGMAYMSSPMGFEGEPAPAGFTGPYDGWHWHDDLCFFEGGLKVANLEACSQINGVHVERTGYILHVWLDNPAGLFAHHHPGLKGSSEYITPVLP